MCFRKQVLQEDVDRGGVFLDSVCGGNDICDQCLCHCNLEGLLLHLLQAIDKVVSGGQSTKTEGGAVSFSA